MQDVVQISAISLGEFCIAMQWDCVFWKKLQWVNHRTQWGLWPTGQSAAVWVLVSWAKTVPAAAQKESMQGFDQFSSLTTDINISKLPGTSYKNTHINTLMCTIFVVVLNHLVMRPCKWFTVVRNTPNRSAAERGLPHGGIKHNRWELRREHSETWRDKEKEMMHLISTIKRITERTSSTN